MLAAPPQGFAFQGQRFGWKVNVENDRSHTAGCASGVSIHLRAEILAVIQAEPESRILKSSWTPAFAGVTTSVDGVLFKSTKLTPGRLSPA
jgi:hypothetical protein